MLAPTKKPKKASEKGFTTIMLDKRTVKRFRDAAGGMPVATYLRQLSFKCSKYADPVTVAYNEAKELLKTGRVDEEGAYLHFAKTLNSFLGISGPTQECSLIPGVTGAMDGMSDEQWGAITEADEARRLTMSPLLDELDRQDAENIARLQRENKEKDK